MKTIWKYPLVIKDFQEINLPENAEILTVQVQNYIPCLWALVDDDPEKDQKMYKIRIAGTGHTMSDYLLNSGEEYKYISTFQLDNGSIIFHVFLIKNK
jgi:hypothetical protein